MNLRNSVLILVIILVFEPFLWAENGPSAADSVNPGISAQTDSSNMEADPKTDSCGAAIGSQADSVDKGIGSEIQVKPLNNSAVRSEPKKKMVFLVCVARYSTRASAEKHSESLKLFGYEPWIQVKGGNVFLVVLEKADDRPKAEKMKTKYEKRGLTSFIEES